MNKKLSRLLEETVPAIYYGQLKGKKDFLEHIIRYLILQRGKETLTKKPLEINFQSGTIPVITISPGTLVKITNLLNPNSFSPLREIDDYLIDIEQPLLTRFSLVILDGQFAGKEGAAGAAFVMDSLFPDMWEELEYQYIRLNKEKGNAIVFSEPEAVNELTKLNYPIRKLGHQFVIFKEDVEKNSHLKWEELLYFFENSPKERGKYEIMESSSVNYSINETGRGDLVSPLGYSMPVIPSMKSGKDDLDSWYRLEKAKLEQEFGEKPEEFKEKSAKLDKEYSEKRSTYESLSDFSGKITEEMEQSADELVRPMTVPLQHMLTNWKQVDDILSNPIKLAMLMQQTNEKIERMPERANEGVFSTAFKYLTLPVRLPLKAIFWSWNKLLSYFFERIDSPLSAKVRWKKLVAKKKPGSANPMYETITIAGRWSIDYNGFKNIYFAALTAIATMSVVGVSGWSIYSSVTKMTLSAIQNTAHITLSAASPAVVSEVLTNTTSIEMLDGGRGLDTLSGLTPAATVAITPTTEPPLLH